MKLRSAMIPIILAFAILFITASPAVALINNSSLDAQTTLLNEAMTWFVFCAVLITVMSFIGLTNYANALTVGIASIMVSLMAIFIMKIFGYMSI